MDKKVYPLKQEVDELEAALKHWHAELSKSPPNIEKVRSEMQSWVERWHAHGLGKHTRATKSMMGW